MTRSKTADTSSMVELNSNNKLDADFYRAWYKDAASLSDEELAIHWDGVSGLGSRHGNFFQLLKMKGFLLSDVPKRLDWDEYVTQYPDVKKKPLTQYHLIYHYLEQKKEAERFRPEFYRSFYNISKQIADDDVFDIWKNNRGRPGFFSCAEDFLLYMGFGKQTIEAISGLFDNPDLNEQWDSILTLLLMQPVRKLEIAATVDKHQEIYDVVARHYRDAGLIDKSNKISALCAPLESYNKNEMATDREGDNPSKVSRQFEPHFYFNWYPDITNYDLDFLNAHWLEFGTKEGRSPTFEHELLRLGLNSDLLPEKFDWKAYLVQNSKVVGDGLNNRYQAVVDFLKNPQAQHKFDHEFYSSYYADSHVFSNDVNASQNDWIKKSQSEKRFGSVVEYIESLGFSGELFPKWFNHKEVVRLNPGWKKNLVDTILHLLEMHHPRNLRLSEDDSLSAGFYYKLGMHFELKSLVEKAETNYFTALEFAEHPLALENLGNICLRGKLYNHAYDFYTRCIATGKCGEWAYINKVTTCAKLAKFSEIPSIYSRGTRLLEYTSALENSIPEVLQVMWQSGRDRIEKFLDRGMRNNVMDLTLELASTTSQIFESITNITPEKEYDGEVRSDNILIIGDYFLPQCKRYRIDQKLEQLRKAGLNSTAVAWTNHEAAYQEIPFNDICIFYRVPATPEVVRLIATAKSLGKIVIYEIDDLIFDPAYPPAFESYGGYVSHAEYRDLIKGMALYRAAAQLCEYGLASTQPLANELSRLIASGRCFVHRNGLDNQNIMAPNILKAGEESHINIFYGSGTKAHNSDFIDEALPAILKVLDENPKVRLTVVGYLQLPSEVLERFKGQIITAPPTKSIQGYWTYLASADINIAVLKKELVTDAKSELKWFEAGLFGIPSVVSTTQNYIDVIRNGVDGYIVNDLDEWYKILSLLCSDQTLRRDVGQEAYKRVVDQYSVESMASNILNIFEVIRQQHEAKSLGNPQVTRTVDYA